MTSRQRFLSLLRGYGICSATGKETDPVAFAAIEAPGAFEVRGKIRQPSAGVNASGCVRQLARGLRRVAQLRSCGPADRLTTDSRNAISASVESERQAVSVDRYHSKPRARLCGKNELQALKEAIEGEVVQAETWESLRA